MLNVQGSLSCTVHVYCVVYMYYNVFSSMSVLRANPLGCFAVYLQEHYKRLHAETREQFCCPYCNFKTINSKAFLSSHIAMKHASASEVLSCPAPQCIFVTTSQKFLDSHMRLCRIFKKMYTVQTEALETGQGNSTLQDGQLVELVEHTSTSTTTSAVGPSNNQSVCSASAAAVNETGDGSVVYCISEQELGHVLNSSTIDTSQFGALLTNSSVVSSSL